jgi:hypothetical protein
MTVAGGLEGADPTDLAGLREALALADPEGKLAPIGMSRIEIGGDALSSFVERILERAQSAREGL